VGPPHLTVDRKIILHLYEVKHSELDFEVPQGVVQDGIAEAVSIRRDNIPRTMKKLKEEDLVYDVLKRIKGLPRKRKAYFLTDKGMDYAKEVKDEIAYHKVFLQLSDGSIKEIYMKDVPSYLSLAIPLIELLQLVNNDDLVTEKEIRSLLSGDNAAPKKIGSEGFVSFVQDVPMPKRFFGRDRELSEIDQWLGEEGGSILSITGIAGIGKTTLAARSLKRMEGRTHLFWYRFHRWDSLRNVLFSIARFLDQLGRSGLKTYLDSNNRLISREYFSILETSLRDSPIFMVFDDFQRAADEIVDLFSNLKEIVPQMEKLKIIVVGRQVFPFYDRSDVLVKGVVKEMNLMGLDKKSCRGLLKIRNVEKDLFNKVYEITKGHPLFIQLILSAEDLEDQKDIKRYIYEEIFKKLDSRTSLMLQIASVYRYPVPSDAFFMEEGLDFTTLDKLVESNLIQETSYDEYEAHDLIKEFFYNRLTPQQKLDYHRKASEHYMETGNERATVEAMYHMSLGGQPVKALKLASTYGESIITKGLIEQFSSVLSLLENEMGDETREYNATTRLLQGELQMVMGRWDKAQSDLTRAAAIAEAENRPLISGRANLRLGQIESRRGKKDAAEKRLQKALKIARRLKNQEEMAKSLQGLGELFSTRGEFDKAKKALGESLEIALELDDPTLEAVSHTGLGIIHTNQDEADKAIDQFEEAINALERDENALELARVKINLGTVQASTGEYEEAISNFEDAIELCNQTGDIRLQAYALAGAAHVYIMDNEPETAGEYLEEALKIFSSIGEKYKIAMVHLDMGRLHLLKKEYNQMRDDLDLSLSIIEDLNLPFYYRKIKNEIVEMLKSKGRFDEAGKYS
jgi:ATP/maltotriose-dependent transcriptional regulator MalT